MIVGVWALLALWHFSCRYLELLHRISYRRGRGLHLEMFMRSQEKGAKKDY